MGIFGILVKFTFYFWQKKGNICCYSFYFWWVGVRFGDEWRTEGNNGIVSVCVKKINKNADERWAKLDRLLPSIFLVGPMGAGKTTIAKLLAKHFQRQFIDCDQYIVEQAGAEIAWIFEKEGEQGFRERENKALQELTPLPNVVLATGGGAVEWEQNRAMLARGFVIYLDASVEVQLSRTQNSTHRPLLMQGNPQAVLEERYKKRHPLYLSVADMVISTGRLYPKQMVGDILESLSKKYRL